MHTKELFGKEVLDSNANGIGKVNDIDIDMDQGVINHIVVKTGLTKSHLISLDKIDKIGDKVILKITEADLKKK